MKTRFDPLIHGFKFPNRFEFSGFQKLSEKLSTKLIYGMCGGMVFSSLDHYFDQKPIPVNKIVDDLPLNYTKYLWDRQKESLSLKVVLRIIYFSLLPRQVSIRFSIKKELPKIIHILYDNIPAPLVIIRSNILQNPTNNHQVLVTEIKEKKNLLEFMLYDPNHPMQTPKIILNHEANNLTQTTGELVRGFFVNRYLYKSSFES